MRTAALSDEGLYLSLIMHTMPKNYLLQQYRRQNACLVAHTRSVLRVWHAQRPTMLANTVIYFST